MRARWMRNHPGRGIKTEHLGELLKEACLEAATPKNAGSGFRNSGIVPFNPHVIPDHQLLDDPRKPAEVLSGDVSAMTLRIMRISQVFLQLFRFCKYLLPRKISAVKNLK